MYPKEQTCFSNEFTNFYAPTTTVLMYFRRKSAVAKVTLGF